MRGRPAGLLPIELSIIETGLKLRAEGAPEFHGFNVAVRIRDDENARLLTSRGTLYKALDRLEKRGFLESHWEDPEIAVNEGRPRRRLYVVTAAGEGAVAEALAAPSTPRLVGSPAQP